MQREIWKDSTGYTVPIWNSSVSISLAALVSSLCLLQEHHMSRSSRNMLNYWSGADTSQSLDTNSNCIHGPPGPAGWWPIPSDTVLAAVNTRGMRRGGGGWLTLIDRRTGVVWKTATPTQQYKNGTCNVRLIRVMAPISEDLKEIYKHVDKHREGPTRSKVSLTCSSCDLVHLRM